MLIGYLLVVGFIAGWLGRSLMLVVHRHRRSRAWQREAWDLYDRTELPAPWPDHPNCPGSP